MQRYREPCCVFETHSDRHLDGSQDNDPADITNEKIYIVLEDIPPWKPALTPVSPPTSLNLDPSLQSQNNLEILSGTKHESSDPNYLSVVVSLSKYSH